ncbi:MAG: hypothetical protein ACLQIB_18150 [Isosphaeraceae bacterium]
MALPDTHELDPDLLYLFILGPCKGETVLLRVPPDQWMIVDSFKAGRSHRPSAETVITRYGGRVDVLALTHPHADHFEGFIDLIDRYDEAMLGCVYPRDSRGTRDLSADPITALKEGAKPAYTRIWDEWKRRPERRRTTFRRDTWSLGTARVTSLHPVRPVDPAQWSNDPNTISSAMLVEWHNLRLLLGADVPNSEWAGIAEGFPGLNRHAAMKVPHHGSRGAIHTSFADGDPGRFWIITPFYPQRLPRPEDANARGEREGLRQLLSFVGQVHLTALPFRHNSETHEPVATTRQSVARGGHPERTGERPGNLLETDAALNRQVVIGFTRDGTVARKWFGPGSVRLYSEA